MEVVKVSADVFRHFPVSIHEHTDSAVVCIAGDQKDGGQEFKDAIVYSAGRQDQLVPQVADRIESVLRVGENEIRLYPVIGIRQPGYVRDMRFFSTRGVKNAVFCCCTVGGDNLLNNLIRRHSGAQFFYRQHFSLTWPGEQQKQGESQDDGYEHLFHVPAPLIKLV